jgi:hypothetical protein
MTGDPDTKLMACNNTGRIVKVPYSTYWVSELVVRNRSDATATPN